MDRFVGAKDSKTIGLVLSLLSKVQFTWYAEPFGGFYSVGKAVQCKFPNVAMHYNDRVHYDVELVDVYVKHIDAFEYIKSLPKETLLYLDPPYFGKEDLYEGCTHKDHAFHIKLLQTLQETSHRFILSYNNCDFIYGLYHHYHYQKLTGLAIGQVLIHNLPL